MIIYIFPVIMGFAGAFSRDAAKVIKSPPYITNSLVNLGKMDISFYFNAKDQDVLRKMDLSTIPQNTNFMYPKPAPPIDEPCPCSVFRNYKDTNPSAVLNKILSSNDFLSSKPPMTSVLCCESHEEASAHEEPVFIDLGNKPGMVNGEPALALPTFPYVLENLFNKDMPFAQSKPKTIEILFFPKKPIDKNHPKSRFTPSPKKVTSANDNKSLEKEFRAAYDEKTDAVSVKKDLHNMDVSETTTVENKETDENVAKETNNL